MLVNPIGTRMLDVYLKLFVIFKVFRHVLFALYEPKNVDYYKNIIIQNINEKNSQISWHLKWNDKK